ncbi:hypothetical protein AAHA92_17316 [Salvia divinorum]|uniref:Aspartic peptidase DDI1-type domain-containing protein n=1 Tax=Salvia divinorum TaxID=28513 RepID=A0ABD1H199_SALDI
MRRRGTSKKSKGFWKPCRKIEKLMIRKLGSLRQEEARAKAADRVNELNKKWIAKKFKDGASTSGMKNEDAEHTSGPVEKSQWSLKKSQRAADRESKADSNSKPAQNNGEIPRYAKLLREAVMTKHKLKKSDLKLPHHCSAIIQKHRVVKQKDPGQFIICYSIGKGKADKALCDLGASINIMPLELDDNSTTLVVGIVEVVLVKIDDFIFPADFFMLNMDVDKNVPLILGRNFLATCKALIDVGRSKITINDNYNKSTYYIGRAMVKDEEAKRLKQEEELRMIMMTDKSKPLAAQKGEDYSKPSIFIATPPPKYKKQKVPKHHRSLFQERTKREPKPLHLMDAEVYIVKIPNGKYKWWKKIYNKLVPLAVAVTRVIDPPT